MKIILYITICLLFGTFSYGQNIWHPTDNIGIGTTSPIAKLHLVGGHIRISPTVSTAYLFQAFTTGGANDNLGIALHDGATSSSPYLWIAKAGSNWGGPVDKMVIASSKNAGITKDLWIYANDNLAPTTPNILVQANTGNVGIGTTNPQEKLAVNGNVFAKKVTVTMVGWPDFVFYPNYKLPPLAQIEEFIKENFHLPDVPSAAEVAKDGLDLGGNQSILLKKIEELTLYLIEQNKRLEQQQLEIDELKKRVSK